MPSSSIEHYDDATAPFLPSPSSRLPSWRSKAQSFSRRSPLVRHILLFAVVVALGVPVWLFTYHDPHESATTTPNHSNVVQIPPDRPKPPLPFQLDNADIVPNPAHHIPSHHGHKVPSQFKQDKLESPTEPPSNAVQDTSTPVPAVRELVTFALIMWSEGSAQEGVLLIKVCSSLTSCNVFNVSD